MAIALPGSDVRAWPSLSKAAEYLGVAKSTLSRRHDIQGERVGQQEIRLAPATLIRLAHEYRRRGPDEVARDLVEHARTHAPDQVAAVEAEIDTYLAANPLPHPDETGELLDLAQRHLPPDLYRLVEQAVQGGPSRGVIGSAD